MMSVFILGTKIAYDDLDGKKDKREYTIISFQTAKVLLCINNIDVLVLRRHDAATLSISCAIIIEKLLLIEFNNNIVDNNNIIID